MNNLLSYCRLTDARMSPSEKDLPVINFGRPELKNCTQSPRPRPSLRCYRCRLHNSQLFQSKQQSGHEPAKKHIFLVFHWLTLIFSDHDVTVSPLLNNVFSIFCPKMFFKIEIIFGMNLSGIVTCSHRFMITK